MTPASPTRKRHALTGASAGVLAFLAYGAWALWVNWAHGPRAAGLAALAQGISSFTTTLILTTLVTFFYRRLRHRISRAAALRLAPFLSTATTGSLLLVAHLLVGTPRLLATILPSIVVGFGYSAFCAIDLGRVEGA